MSRRRVLDWWLPAALAALLVPLLAAGFALALTGHFGEALAPLPASARAAVRSGAYSIVALGDSLTAGTGDARGHGYAARVAQALRGRGLEVSLSNLAVPGYETRELLRLLEGDETRRAVAGASLLLVSIGGNDLTHGLRAGRGETGASADDDKEQTLGATAANLRAIVARLRAANPTAPIRLIGLYNPFEVLPEGERQARAQLLAWNEALERAALEQPGVLVVPVADLFVERPDRLAGDRFHPGPKGHEAIAARVASTLREAEAP